MNSYFIYEGKTRPSRNPFKNIGKSAVWLCVRETMNSTRICWTRPTAEKSRHEPNRFCVKNGFIRKGETLTITRYKGVSVSGSDQKESTPVMTTGVGKRFTGFFHAVNTADERGYFRPVKRKRAVNRNKRLSPPEQCGPGWFRLIRHRAQKTATTQRGLQPVFRSKPCMVGKRLQRMAHRRKIYSTIVCGSSPLRDRISPIR